VSFVELLKQAEIVACAYHYAQSGPLGVPMREIALVGRNAEALARVFAEFKRWSNSTDGDAVELIFIFLKGGGYLLSIGRELTRATRDFRGSDRTVSPILMSGSYIKKFDTRHPAVEELREYKSKFLISPFLFGAAFKRGSDKLPILDDVQPLHDLEPLLKFEAEFLDEEDILPGTSHHLLITLAQQSEVLKKDRKASIPRLPEPRQQQPADYFRHRTEMLGRHFPVTIERIRSGRYSTMMTSLKAQGVRDWQIEQAVCNLLLSASFSNGQPFYTALEHDEFTNRIVDALRLRQEKSDTPDLSHFSSNDILTQVRLDALELLREVGRPSSLSTLDSLQKKLADVSLLEPGNA
jgi:hypothetical protein